jgi:hypothetical protein
MVASAVVGSAALGAVVSSRNTSKAVNSQENAANQASATANAQYQQTRADNAPFREAGLAALNKLSAAPAFSFDGSNVATDPGYQFGLQQGQAGLTNSAASRGGLLSGAALKAASQYNTDYATTKFNDAYNRALTTSNTNNNRLASIAGVGQVATNAIGNAGQAMSQQVASNQLAAGNARASGYVAQGNALTNSLGQATNWYTQNQLLNGSSVYSPVVEGATNQTANFDKYGWNYSP